MIEQIEIKSAASYSNAGSVIDSLSKINVFYGSNGSGKTTISRVISGNDDDEYKDCSLKWSDDIAMDAFVYNKDFVEKNFNQDDQELKGIFTLGEEDDQKLKFIKVKNEEIEALKTDLKGLRHTLKGADGESGKIAELEKLEADFANTCWKIKDKHDEYFKDAFSGVRDKKVKFKNKLVDEAENNTESLTDLEELKQQSETVFASELVKHGLIEAISYDRFEQIENDTILQKKIIGKDDVDIAAMISRLGNSDWVKEGRAYFEENNDHCPFCQQETDAQFAQNLNEYFDDAYNEDTGKVKDLAERYDQYSTELLAQLEKTATAGHEFLNQDQFTTQKELLEAKLSINAEHLNKKLKEASSVVTLETLKETVDQINALILAANAEATKHNDLVDNHITVKQKLVSQIWCYVVDELRDQYSQYRTDKINLENAINSLQTQIQGKETEQATKTVERDSVQAEITGVEATVAAINTLLSSFGFTGFKLAESDTKGFYKIIREDGSDAQKSLSEGEKTFVTFLYFYHLLNGGDSEQNIMTDRVIVIDDPVSSLDSDILFIVSNLTRKLLHKVGAKTNHIKQVFVLTHNVYFHKEVTFSLAQGKRKICNKVDLTFWMVRKVDGVSSCKKHEENPIKTSYELLWDEVRNENRSSHTIQNTLRRILENYFKILGGHDNFDAVIDQFDGEDKKVCRSLFAWIHDGSHSIYDDLHVSCTDDQVDMYLKVFRMIFDKTEHLAHYKMMMKETDDRDDGSGEIVELAA